MNSSSHHPLHGLLAGSQTALPRSLFVIVSHLDLGGARWWFAWHGTFGELSCGLLQYCKAPKLPSSQIGHDPARCLVQGAWPQHGKTSPAKKEDKKGKELHSPPRALHVLQATSSSRQRPKGRTSPPPMPPQILDGSRPQSPAS